MMDLQAGQLRQLVRDVRRAAIISTGPPVLVIVAANEAVDAEAIRSAIHSAAEARGIRVSSLLDLSEETDWQLIDAGVGFSPDDANLWQRATALLMVTSTNEQTVLDTYTAFKLASRELSLPALELLVQEKTGDQSAERVYDRLSDTLERFLDCQPAGLTVPGTQQNYERLIDRLLLLAPATSCNTLASTCGETV